MGSATIGMMMGARFPSLFPSKAKAATKPSSFVLRCSPFSVPSSSFPAPPPEGNVSCERMIGSKVLLKEMLYVELEAWVKSIGFKSGQALMLWKWMYGNGKWAQNADGLQGFNKAFQEVLRDSADFNALLLKDVRLAADGTRKILFGLEKDSLIETVVIPCARGRTTVCVSSQVGCAMNCQFCLTGRMGLKKNLSTAQIVEQLVVAQRMFTGEIGPITNVVFMGMGEPLHNINNVLRASEIMVNHQGLHLSPNKVTVSTSGLVPQIRRFCRESPCSLAVSLNATTDEVRNWIMPINRKYSIDTLLGALREEIACKKGFKVLIEYVMLAGINDSLEDARRLVKLVEGIPCKINLISFNPHVGSEFLPTPKDQMLAFRNSIANSGLVVAIRSSRGDDQMAACGQLGKIGYDGVAPPPRLRVPLKFQPALASGA